MSNPVAIYELSSHPLNTTVLRARTVVWREESALVIVDASGTRTILTDWKLNSHELSSDGQFVLALGDDGKRAAVWDTRTRQQLLSLVGQEGRPQSLRVGLATIEGELFAFVAIRNQDVTIVGVRDGAVRGWLATTGMIWFHVLQVFQLEREWLTFIGYHDGESRDRAVALRASEVFQDPMLLYGVLTEHLSIREWGYRVAIGPAGPGQAVVFRDPEWEEDDGVPDDPTESFCGLVIWDLASAQVVQRIAYNGELDTGAQVGADGNQVAIEGPGYVEIVARDTGAVRRIETVALDPYRLEVARIEGNLIVITHL